MALGNITKKFYTNIYILTIYFTNNLKQYENEENHVIHVRHSVIVCKKEHL